MGVPSRLPQEPSHPASHRKRLTQTLTGDASSRLSQEASPPDSHVRSVFQTVIGGVSSRLAWATPHPHSVSRRGVSSRLSLSHRRRLIQTLTEGVSSRLSRETLHPDSLTRAFHPYSHGRRLARKANGWLGYTSPRCHCCGLVYPGLTNCLTDFLHVWFNATAFCITYVATAYRFRYESEGVKQTLCFVLPCIWSVKY